MRVLILMSLICTNVFCSYPHWALSGSFSYLDTWLPSKIGANLIYKNEDLRTIELSYQRASYSFNVLVDDFGRITDQRFMTLTRSFKYQESFNYHYGLSLNQLSADLGPSQAAAIGYKFDIFKITTLNILWGVGNRFTINENWFAGIDWFRVYFPIYAFDENGDDIEKSDSSSKKDDLKDAKNLIQRIPTFSLLVLELGYKF